MTTSPALLCAINEYVDDAAAHGEIMIPVKEKASALAAFFTEKTAARIEDKIRDRVRAKSLVPID